MHPTRGPGVAGVFAAGTPSHLFFYVAGIVLVCWAVGLAAAGLTHPGFPGSQRGKRLVMLTTFVLVATTLATAVITGTGPEGHQATSAPAAR
jgi:hypothetical protein